MSRLRKPRRTAASAYAATPREALEHAGGVAGARWIADWLHQRLGKPVKVRQVRDRLKHYGDGIEKLGAGYYALGPAPPLPVDIWATRWLALRPHPVRIHTLVDAILDEYPNGDHTAVRAWVFQEVGALRVRDGHVWLVSQLARKAQ